MLNNPINPLCPEQSLLGFIGQLGLLENFLYTSIIEELARKGQLRYSDGREIDMIMQSPDGQFQITVLYSISSASRRGRVTAFFHKLYPDKALLHKKEYISTKDLYEELRSAEAKRLNLRQHKTTLNIYAETLPPKISKALSCKPQSWFQ